MTFSPGISTAHGPGSLEGGPSEIFKYVEDQILDDATHAEVEELLIKIFTEEITESEAARFAELLKMEPEAVSLMTNRFWATEAERSAPIEIAERDTSKTLGFWALLIVAA